MSDPAEIQEIVRELAVALRYEAGDMIPNYEVEAPPDEIELLPLPIADDPGSADEGVPSGFGGKSAVSETGDQLYQGVQSEANSGTSSSVASSFDGARAGHQTGRPVVPAVPAQELPVNYRCTRCQDRMYPIKKFFRSGSLPVLVLHYSGTLSNQPVRPDRSDKLIFGSEAEDNLFERMLGALDLKMGDFHYQEYLACFFNPDRSLAEEWNERGRNCLSHVADTVRRENIRLVLLTGPAAILLLGEEKALEFSASGQIFPLPFEDREIPGLAIRSPAALLALEQKRLSARSAGRSEEEQKFKATEKKIKTAVISALKQALQQIQ